MSTHSTTMTVRDLLDLFTNFRSLNGAETVVKQGESERVVPIAYQFDANACWNLAKNLGVLKKHVKQFETSRSLALSGLPKDSPTYEKDVTDALNTLLDKEVEVSGLLKIKRSGLKLDKNAIPPGTLAALIDFIEED